MTEYFDSKVLVSEGPFAGVTGHVDGVRKAPKSGKTTLCVMFDRPFKLEGVIYGTKWFYLHELTILDN